MPTRDEERLVGYLGPDPLADDWDPAEAARRLGADPRPVHVAVQDQRNVAGFGNEYANEILFVRGILPTTPANETDAAAIVDLGARMIRANRDRVDRTFTGDTRPGRTTWVYRREGRPCRRCGTLIRGGALGADPTRERIVFWCPSCQVARREARASAETADDLSAHTPRACHTPDAPRKRPGFLLVTTARTICRTGRLAPADRPVRRAPHCIPVPPDIEYPTRHRGAGEREVAK